jgi:sigma-B regulation protein RsbU (phosphoserine phosphatase)
VLDRDGTVQPITRGLGQPLGIMDEPELVEHTLTIPPGGVMLLHSDGAPDALDPDGVAFGLERLRTHTSAQHPLPAQALCDRLLAILTEYQGSAPQHDDITLLAVHAEA